MPIFGTSTAVTSLGQLQTLDAEARLSVQQRDGKNVLVATKGTLSDGLYSLWAYFRPAPARQARLDTLTTLRKTIADEFHLADDSITLHAEHREQKFTQDLQGTRLFISDFKGANLKDYFNFTGIKRLEPSSTETATNDPSAAKDYFNFTGIKRLEPSSTETATNDPSAASSPLERILYKNQFQLGTDATDYVERQKFVSDSRRLLENVFTIEAEIEKEAASTLASTLFTASLPPAPPSQYRIGTESELDTFKALKEAIEQFKKKRFPVKQEDLDRARDATATHVPDPLKKFEHALIDFLDQNPGVLLENLQSYLNKYDANQTSPQPSQIRQGLISNDPIREVKRSIQRNPQLTSTKIRDMIDQLDIISVYPELSTKIAEIGRTNDYQQFFAQLKQLSSPESKFFDRRLNQKTSLNKTEQKFFINQLLGVFTIGEANNPGLHQFFTSLGNALQNDLIDPQEASTLKDRALQILQTNKSNKEKVKTFSTGIKEKVLAHQEAEKQWKKAVKTNPDAARPTMDYLSERYSAVREPLLSPDATALLAFTILSLTPPEERAAT